MEADKKDIFSEISSLTRKIEEEYPELQKYLDETRETLKQGNFDNNKIEKKDLEDYRNSLKELIQRYQQEENIKNKKP
tara:strand:- start:18414 stop:18647 length:234 start_codon:yes stop_codon:yes gene_type:complete